MLKENDIKYLHLDVMDGMYVPNISFGIPVIKNIKENVKNDFILDTHLMIERPERYILDFKNNLLHLIQNYTSKLYAPIKKWLRKGKENSFFENLSLFLDI